MNTATQSDDQPPGLIRRIEALRYRGFDYVVQDVAPFAVLVGPNGSGKSTFLDCVALLRDYLDGSLDTALLLGPDETRGRSRSVEELIHNRQGRSFEIALDLSVPADLVYEETIGGAPFRFDMARYQLAIGATRDGAGVLGESLWLIDSRFGKLARRGRAENAPSDEPSIPDSLFVSGVASMLGNIAMVGEAPEGWRLVVARDVHDIAAGIYMAERVLPDEDSRWRLAYRPGADRSALAGLPDEPERFPVASWARDLLRSRVYRLTLSATAMRRPTSPSTPRDFQPDGGNLPQVVLDITAQESERYYDWVAHVQTILPEVDGIFVKRLPEDNRLYLQVKYRDSAVPIPSWLLSDGTLRLLALTLLPYLPGDPAIYLIEEPEDGLHPRAIEGVFQSLSSVYDGQVLVATHSPLFVGLADPAQLLCFARSPSGAVRIVPGDRHPALANWRGQVELSTLYASGVLG
jgi:predicted ATPase